MTAKEIRHIFDLKDVCAIRLGCQKCGSELLLKPSDGAIPINCPAPGCGAPWTQQGSPSSHNAALLDAIRKALLFEEPHVIVRFEIDGEEGKA